MRKAFCFTKMHLHIENFSLTESCQLVYGFNNHFFNIFLCLLFTEDFTAQRKVIHLWVSRFLGTTIGLHGESLIQSVSKLLNSYYCHTLCQVWGESVFESVFTSLPSLPCQSQTTVTFPLTYCQSIPLDFPDSSLSLFQSSLSTAARVVTLKTNWNFPCTKDRFPCSLISYSPYSSHTTLPQAHHLLAMLAPFPSSHNKWSLLRVLHTSGLYLHLFALLSLTQSSYLGLSFSKDPSFIFPK